MQRNNDEQIQVDMKEVSYLCKKCRVYSVTIQTDKEFKKGKKCPICEHQMEVTDVVQSGGG